MNHLIKWKLGVLIFACVLLLVSSAFGQGTGAKLDGTVRDSQGLIIRGAMVIATNEATGVARESYTNEAGIFVFSSLPPGKYNVSTEVQGFKKAEVTGFVLEVATSKTLDFKLVVGGSSEMVTVTADSIQQVQLASSDLGDVVVEKQIKDMPLNGRIPIELAFLQPGAAGSNKQGGWGGLSVNGSRPQANLVAMDGVEVTNGELGTGTAGINISTDVLLPLDAIEEFRVITANPSAEYGRASGFQVNISTKSGTNQLHGNLYEFYRGTVLNANSFFNNASATPVARPPLLRNQFGASLGGPIEIPGIYNGKNRTFFFANYEGTRQVSAMTWVRTVLTQEARNGIFRFITPGVTKNPDTGVALTRNSGVVVDSTGKIRDGVQGIQTLDLINADKKYYDGVGADTTGVIKKMVDATSLPNDFIAAGDGLNTAAFRWNPSAPAVNDLVTLKLDHTLGKHSLSLRGNFGRMDRVDTTNLRYAPYPGGYSRWRYEDQRGLAFNAQSPLKPNLTHEVHIGLSRNVRQFQTNVDPGNLGLAWSVVADSYSQPFPIYEFQITARQTETIGDSITWVKGRHVIKGGFEFRSTPVNQLTTNKAIGVNFSSAYAIVNTPQLFGTPTGTNPIPSADTGTAQGLFNQLTGRIGLASATFNAINENAFGPLSTFKDRGFRQRDWGGYFQDDWKVNKKLTLNLGLRYDFFQVPWEVNSMYALSSNRKLLDTQLNPALAYTPVSFARVGPKFGTQLYNNDLNNFGPVVGFSWDPWGNNKTAIRGSYRINYDKMYEYTLSTIEPSVPGMNYASSLTATQFQSLYPLTNASGQARTLRLADLVSTPTQIGVNVGSGTINLASALNITSTQKPLSLLPDTRGSYSPADYNPNLVNPYSQSWSVGIQREIMRNTIVEIRYVGRKGTHDYGAVPSNQYRAPADILSGLRTVQGLLKMTNQDAFAKAGIALPSGVSPTASVTISQLYGSAPDSATSMSQYTPGALASLAPTSLSKIFLGMTNSSASNAETYMRNNNLPSIMGLLDWSATLRTNAFLTASGLQPVPTGGKASGWLPQAIGLASNAFRPNLQFGTGPITVESDFNSNYSGLQAQLTRRFYQGLELQANYTYSRNRDVTSTTLPTSANVTDFFNRSADYGLSSNDVPHDFKANAMYELPFGVGKRYLSSREGFIGQLVGGWQVSTIFEISSAFPMSFYYGSQSTSFGGGTRPDLAPGVSLDSVKSIGEVGRDSQGHVIYFTTDEANTLKASFQSAQLGTIGSLPKNAFRGPKYWDVTMATLKNFRITETKSVQFRGEFFNLFNHANMGDPDLNLESGTFGRITATRGDPRIIQFGLKINY